MSALPSCHTGDSTNGSRRKRPLALLNLVRGERESAAIAALVGIDDTGATAGGATVSQSRSSFGPLLPVRQRAQREPCGGGGDQTDRASLEGNVRKVGSIPKTKMADAATTHTPPAEPRTTSSISSQLADSQHAPTSQGSQEFQEHNAEGAKRKESSREPEEAQQDNPDDVEYRRLRRRITNRESAKRMRIKRQEELASFQKELKRVTQENEQLKKYSAYMQKQHVVMATDIQHWQNKCATANAEVGALFQQLQQVVALSAAFNPAILEAIDTRAVPVQQNPTMEALIQALPQARVLSEAMEALRTSGAAPKPDPPPPPAALSSVPASAAALTLPSSSPLSAMNLAALSQIAAAAGTEKPAPRQPAAKLVQPKPLRPASTPAPTGSATTAHLLSKLRDAANSKQEEGPAGSTSQQPRYSGSLPSLDVEAILAAARSLTNGQ